MKETVLEKRIHKFLHKKEIKYPELHASVDKITRELMAQDIGGR